MKPFLCQLEGIFRLLPENTKRVDQDLLNGIDQSFRAKGSLESYLAACEDASIFCLGDKKSAGEALSRQCLVTHRRAEMRLLLKGMQRPPFSGTSMWRGRCLELAYNCRRHSWRTKSFHS